MDPVLWALVGAVSAAIVGVGGAIGAPAVLEAFQRKKFDRELRRSQVADLKRLRMTSDEALRALEASFTSLFETGDFEVHLQTMSNAAHGPVDDYGSPTISVLSRELQGRIDTFLDSLNQAKARYTILSGTPGGVRQLDETKGDLSEALSEIRACRQQLRDEIVQASTSLGHQLPPGPDAKP